MIAVMVYNLILIGTTIWLVGWQGWSAWWFIAMLFVTASFGSKNE
jgi:hypothetical protein